MAKRVITLSIGAERVTFYAGDWPAIKEAVRKAITTEGEWHSARGRREIPKAVGFTVADESKLAKAKV
nr:hypothetical protein [Halomonas socia]